MLVGLVLLALGLAACKFGFKDVNLATGVRLNYAELEYPGHRHNIVLLHGYTDSWFSFSRVLQRLPPTVHAMSVSQRGHGDSEKPTCCYNQSDFSADVEAFLDAKGLDQAIIVGHSMGSLIAHKFAAEHPDRVEKLILIGTAPTMQGREDFQGFLDMLIAEPGLCSDPDFVRAFQESTVYTGEGANPLPAEFLNKAIEESLKVQAYTWQGALADLHVENHVAQLSQITAPTLIMWGDKDSIYSYDDQQVMLSSIPNVTLKTYANTGHAVHWERPNEVVRDMMAFIRHH